MSPADRRARVERDDPVLAIVAQCRLLKIARSTLYYRAAPVDPDDLAVMRRMDELYLASPFYGSRRMVSAAASGVRDGGRPPAIGLQEQVANHRKRRGSKARVVSVTEKAPRGVR